jgi:alpha-1,2-mannosyltransferase
MIVPILLLSVSRSMALSINYSSPIKVYEDLYRHISSKQNTLSFSVSPSDEGKLLVCTCGEWYRFPSSFHLPKHTHLAFLKSSFDGQLPQPFTIYGSKVESIGLLNGKFNNLNKEEPDRYVSPDDCSYIVELETGDEDGYVQQPECLIYMHSSPGKKKWRKIYSRPFLNSRKTPFLNRILYIPFHRQVLQQEYSVYEASI